MSASPELKSKRPLSPHLQVYKPQMTSLTSVLHRVTGVALAYGLFVFTWWLVAAAIGPEAYGMFTDFAGSGIGKLLMFGWSLAFYYHFANGIRHLIWDYGKMLTIKDAYASGFFILLVTAFMTGVTWYCLLTFAGV